MIEHLAFNFKTEPPNSALEFVPEFFSQQSANFSVQTLYYKVTLFTSAETACCPVVGNSHRVFMHIFPNRLVSLIRVKLSLCFEAAKMTWNANVRLVSDDLASFSGLSEH